MKKVEINLNEIEIKDLNGVVYKVDDLAKQIGNIIFTNATSIEVSDLARTIHAGKVAGVNEDELQEIIRVVAANPYYRPFAHTQILQYLNKQKTLNDKK